MSEMQVAGIASELTLGIGGFLGPARQALAEGRVLASGITAALAGASASGTASIAGLGESIASEMRKASAASSREVGTLGRAISESFAGADVAVVDLGLDLRTLNAEAGRTRSGVGELGREVSASFAVELARADDVVVDLAADLRGLGLIATRTRSDVDELGRELVASLAPEAAAAERQVAALNATMSRMPPPSATVTNWGAGLRSMVGVAGMTSPAIGQLASGFMAVEGAAAATGVSLGVAVAAVAGIAVPLVAAKQAFDFGAASVGVAADMEQVQIAFTTLLGSADRAKAKLDELKDFAEATPFAFPEVADTARQLITAGVAADDVGRYMGMLGDVATGTQSDLNGLGIILTQVMNKGKADTQDLMQLANRGVPIWRVLGETIGVNGVELRKLVEAGEVGLPQVEAALKSMTTQGGMFFNATANASGSMRQLVSQLGDAWTRLQDDVGKVITENLDLKGTIGDIVAAVKAFRPAAVEAFDGASRLLSPFLEIGRALLALIVEVVGPLSEISGGFDEAFGDGTSSSIKDVTMLLNPLTFVAGTLAKTIGAIVEMLKWIKEQRQGIADQLYAAVDSEVTADDIARARAEQESGAVERERELDRAKKQAAERAAAAPKTPGAAPGERTPANEAPATPGTRGAATPARPAAAPATDAQRDAERAAKDQADAAMRAWSASIAAAAAKLRNDGFGYKADELELKAKTAVELRDAKSPDERRAIEARAQQDLYALIKSWNDRTKQDEDRARTARETDDRAQAERTADYRSRATIAGLEAAGEADAAEVAAFDARWRKAIAAITDARERSAALGARDAERDLLLIGQAARAQSAAARGTGRGRAGGPGDAADDRGDDTLAALRERASRRNRDNGDRSLAQLDLREALGNVLSRGDAARQDRLRDRLGVASADVGAGARRRVQGLQAARGGRRDADGDDEAPPASAGRDGAGGRGVTVNVPALSEAKLALEIGKVAAQLFQPIAAREVAKLERRLAGAAYAANAGEGRLMARDLRLTKYEQTVDEVGNGTRYRVASYAGDVPPILVKQDRTVRVLTQQGQAVAWPAYLVPPAPLFPESLLEPPRIAYAKVGPREYRTTWAYTMALADDATYDAVAAIRWPTTRTFVDVP